MSLKADVSKMAVWVKKMLFRDAQTTSFDLRG